MMMMMGMDLTQALQLRLSGDEFAGLLERGPFEA